MSAARPAGAGTGGATGSRARRHPRLPGLRQSLDADAGAQDTGRQVEFCAQAVRWLHADLQTRRELSRRNEWAVPAVAGHLRHALQHDPDLATIRDLPLLTDLSESEREACGSLWVDYQGLLEELTGGR